MPDLHFRITGVEPAAHGLVPLLHFQLEVTNKTPEQQVHTAIIQAQIQLEAARRTYADSEKEKLRELFGEPARWGQTLRTRLWTHASTALRAFSENTTAILPVTCTYDLNVGTAKYFYGLDEGDVPLLFLFSGTVFYAADDGRLQAQQISREKECSFRLPVRTWRELMDYHYPDSAWLALPRETFDRLYAFKRENGLTSWEQVIDRLLAEARPNPSPFAAASTPR